MKKSRDVDELAKQLTTAVTTPLQSVSPSKNPSKETDIDQMPKKRRQKSDAVPVFLRLPAQMYKHFDEIAVARTKETGRGISVQQIILEQLERGQ